MIIRKRDGHSEMVSFHKISTRINKLCSGLDSMFIDAAIIAQKVIEGLYPGVTTIELDELLAQTVAGFVTKHSDFSILAGRIVVSNLHKQTSESFVDVIKLLHSHVEPKTKQPSPLISNELYNDVMDNKEKLNAAIKYDRDYKYDYFRFKTLEKSYLLSIDKKIIERPQHLIMRVALGIHGKDINAAIETYDLMSSHFFIHATPTLYNAGTSRPQLSFCFLVSMKEDSIDGIYDTLKNCAIISKYAGGIGLSVHNVRASNSYIRGSNSVANGIVPMLRVFNNSARYVDQGGGKRKGSIAIYLEPWHADIIDFLNLKKNHGHEIERARDLFYALWIPDLFMKRVESNGVWSLFCPIEAPGHIADVCGDTFETLYIKYESESKARKTIPAQDLWLSILSSQVETGTPYMLYKDACNSKSNQKHLGTIKSSNLCTEIVEFTASDEIAVCNLASINLSAFVHYEVIRTSETIINNDTNSKYDFQKLYDVTKVVTRNLNKIIDINFYPVPEAKNSNMKHRPIGIGVQGLADTFAKMRYPYESQEAVALNKDIFETMYFAAMEASCELAQKDGPYTSFKGSPVSKGILQPDMWNVIPSNIWNWEVLRKKIAQFGVRNSLLIAPMPTASTAQILGNNESIETFTSNIYNRRVLAGEFVVMNKYLLKDLVKIGLWLPEVRNKIIADKGSVQKIASIPQNLKDLYKTAWEIKQRAIIDQAADRGAFICQSQSLNIFMADPTVAKLTSMHFYGWKKGLKTGMYYLRSLPKADAIQFTVDQYDLKKSREAMANVNTSKNTTTNQYKKEFEINEVDVITCEFCSA